MCAAQRIFSNYNKQTKLRNQKFYKTFTFRIQTKKSIYIVTSSSSSLLRLNIHVKFLFSLIGQLHCRTPKSHLNKATN